MYVIADIRGQSVPASPPQTQLGRCLKASVGETFKPTLLSHPGDRLPAEGSRRHRLVPAASRAWVKAGLPTGALLLRSNDRAIRCRGRSEEVRHTQRQRAAVDRLPQLVVIAQRPPV